MPNGDGILKISMSCASQLLQLLQVAEIFLMLEEAVNFVALNEDLIGGFQIDLVSNNQGK